MPGKKNFQELARIAKVSPATVSRVARGNANVSAEIQARVRKAAAKLGIDLEKRTRTRIIAFLLANRDVLHGFQARILLGAEAYCSANGWELLFQSFRYPPNIAPKGLHLPQILNQGNTARAVILGGTNSTNLLEALRARDIPFSVLGNNVIGDWEPAGYDVVRSDDVHGAAEITAHLISQGHRDIWFIGNTDYPWFARCAEGYARAMAAAGLPPRMSDMRSDGTELGYLAAKSILTRHEPVTAIFAGSDQVAGGVYRALRESGVMVPDEISVAGFNDTEGALLHPGLTTMREFPEELGQHLAQFAIRRVTQPELPPGQLTIPTQLLRRESVRPLPRSIEQPALMP